MRANDVARPVASAETIAAALKAKKSGSGWTCSCVSHEDKNPSMSIREVNGKTLVKCHAGCSQEALISELEHRGLWSTHDPAEIPLKHFSLGEYHQHWDYHDAAGQHVQRICRWDKPGGKKDIRPLTWQDNRWQWKALPESRPLYHLPKLKLQSTARVLVVEGEKAADAAQKLFTEFAVTCWAGGAEAAAKTDWKPLAGRDVTLWPDADAPGRKAMHGVATTLAKINCTVQIADLSQLGILPSGWDAADALADKNIDLDALWTALESAKPLLRLAKTNGVTARSLAEVMSTPSRVRWLKGLRKVLERGVIAIAAGKRGSYKSFWVNHLGMLAAIEGEVVLIVTAEGAGSDRRAAAWFKVHGQGRGPSDVKVFLIERRIDFNSHDGIAALLQEIERLQIRPALLIIDTLSKNSGALDEDKNSEVKGFIGRLDVGIRTPLDCTILIVAHTGHGDQSRPRGASAIEADTDAAYIVTKEGDCGVTVSRERFKDAPELPPLNYRVEVVDLGYCDDDGEPATSCVLIQSECAPATVSNPAFRGKAQRQLLAAIRARANGDAQKIWTLDDLRRIGREAGMSKSTARSAVEAVTFSPYMSQTLGGYRLSEDRVEKVEQGRTTHFDRSTRVVKVESP